MSSVGVSLMVLLALFGSVVFMIFPLSSPSFLEQHRILVVTMVKNEERILPRLLASVERLNGFILVCDTGSTDKTITMAKQHARVVDIFMSNTGWVHFEHNRNECLNATLSYLESHTEFKYVLFVDADTELATDKHVSFDLEKDCHSIQIRPSDEEYPYNSVLALVRASVLHRCRYRLWTHEFLDCGTNATTTTHFGLHLIHHHDSDARQTGAKFERDISLLQQWISTNDDLLPRALFYLATSLEGAGKDADAVEMYKRHLQLETFSNYRYQSRYQIARISIRTNKSESVNLFLEAIREYDGVTRYEPFYYLARMARVGGDYNACIALTGAAISAPPIDHARKPLFLEPAIYHWALEEERAFCLMKTHRTSEARDLYAKLLTRVTNKSARTRITNALK